MKIYRCNNCGALSHILDADHFCRCGGKWDFRHVCDTKETYGLPTELMVSKELEKQLTFRTEEDEMIRSMLQKQEAEIREYREKYEIAQNECVRLQAENERLRCCFNCDHTTNGKYSCCKLDYVEMQNCLFNNLKHWKPKEMK